MITVNTVRIQQLTVFSLIKSVTKNIDHDREKLPHLKTRVKMQEHDRRKISLKISVELLI